MWLARATALLALLLLPGCFGTTSAYVEADAPVGIEAYPRTYYDGRVVYLVGDRWYTYDDGVWLYYSAEPAYLYRYRVHFYDRYPARRSYYYYAPRPYYYAPRPYYRPYGRPAYSRPYRYTPYRRSAPPARLPAAPVRRH